MPRYSNRQQPALKTYYNVLFGSSTRDRHAHDIYIGGRSENNIKNASCMTISGGRTKQLDIFCRVTGFTSDFPFIVELIRFFHWALQFFSYVVKKVNYRHFIVISRWETHYRRVNVSTRLSRSKVEFLSTKVNGVSGDLSTCALIWLLFERCRQNRKLVSGTVAGADCQQELYCRILHFCRSQRSVSVFARHFRCRVCM